MAIYDIAATAPNGTTPIELINQGEYGQGRFTYAIAWKGDTLALPDVLDLCCWSADARYFAVAILRDKTHPDDGHWDVLVVDAGTSAYTVISTADAWRLRPLRISDGVIEAEEQRGGAILRLSLPDRAAWIPLQSAA